MSGVSIKNETRSACGRSRLAFSKIAEDILPGWELSLVFVTPAKALELNKKLRGKNYVPNVLSYTVGEKNCEVIICPSEAREQAPAYNLQPTTYNLLLFIHGVLHIKGWVHGAKMERCERKILTRYEATHSDRYRYRNVPGKNGSRGRII
jgi:rRNA maturation RNase YbeY